MPRILVVGEDTSALARIVRATRQKGFDVVGVKADADLRHLWRNQRFDAVVLRAELDDGARAEFLAEMRERDPDLPVFDRSGSDEEMSRFLDGVVEELRE